MIDNEISAREYGNLESEVKHLTEQMALMQADLRCIRDLLEQSKGGWRTIMWLGGAAASVSVGISWLINHWPKQ